MAANAHERDRLTILVTDALAHLARQLERGGRSAVTLPAALRPTMPTWTTLQLEELVDDHALELLQAEARRQDLSLGGLTHHALILYLADADRTRSASAD